MSESETDLRLAAEVARIKQMAVAHNVHLTRALGVCLVAGIAVGFGVWFLQKPIDRDANMVSAVLALGLATFFLGGLFCRMIFRKPNAKCPRCGCDWNIESENDMHKWFNWNRCPGCGLKMRDDAG